MGQLLLDSRYWLLGIISAHTKPHRQRATQRRLVRNSNRLAALVHDDDRSQ